jgi:hypothetical protein
MTYLDLVIEENILSGDVSGLRGDVSGLSGDVSGLSGDVSNFPRGDYDVYENLAFIAIQHAYEAGEIK